MKKKIYLSILVLFCGFFSFGGNVLATELVQCGSVDNIPAKLPELVRIGFTLIKYITPVLIIVLGSLDFFKAITANDSDMVAKTFKVFSKRLIAGVVVFLVFMLFQIAISVVAKSNDFADCAACFLTSSSSCTVYTQKEETTPIDDDDIIDDYNNNQTEFDNETEGSSSDYNIFVGDSRFNGMRTNASAKDVYYAVDGASLNSFDYVNSIKNFVAQNGSSKKYNIIINLGVNSCGSPSSANDYVKKYKGLIDGDWKNFNVYIVSVNPVNEAKYTGASTNANIDAFNNIIDDLNGYTSKTHYCNTNSGIKFVTTDGLHYDPATYTAIYNYIIDKCL